MRLKASRPRFTIERLRTLVLIGGGLLVVAIAGFLLVGRWTRRLLNKDLPGRLGINIEQRSDGVDYTQSRKGKTLFKLHADRTEQMKKGNQKGDRSMLHGVTIHLYGEDGKESDTISGSEFEYDPATGLAQAAGAVEITLMRPGVKPAIAQLRPDASKPDKPAGNNSAANKAAANNSAANNSAAKKATVTASLNPIANQISDSQIHVKTSGLTFSQKSGIATTEQRVEFTLQQGSGASVGATYDSSRGLLILDHAVELHILRPQSHGDGGAVAIHANHAEFERGEQLCRLTQALAESSGDSAQIGDALIHFREDGSVVRLDGASGVDLSTQTGGHVIAPTGALDFDENNHPRQGLLEGGARFEMSRPNRQIDGSSPTAKLQFDRQGQLRQAHLERGVQFTSRQQTENAKGTPVEVRRNWKSQTADIAFVPASEVVSGAKAPSTVTSQSRTELRSIHGYGGVIVTSEASSAGVVSPSRLAADTVVAEWGPGGVLSSLSGAGHATFEERTPRGIHQSSSSDQLDVHFVSAAPLARKSSPKLKESSESSEIASVVQIGHVVLTQDAPPVRAGQASQIGTQAEVRATSNRADYDGKSQLLRLSGSPRVRDGSLDMTATLIDFARDSGDAVARGDVRTSWSGSGGSALPGASLLSGGSGQVANGPVHAIADIAELHQATQQIVFRGAPSGSRRVGSGNQPRLWQSANSVSAPIITLDREKQTLDAESSGAANPVFTVLVINPSSRSGPNKPGSAPPERNSGASLKSNRERPGSAKVSEPTVMRVRSGDLHYSEGERLALFHAGSVGSVNAETTGTDGTSTVTSQAAEVKLFPAGIHNGSGASSVGNSTNGNAAIDRLTARGHVTVNWPGRKGSGEKLVYLSDDDTFTLTGTSAAPPRITDQDQGTITGNALIFHGRDDSVTVEGDGHETVTETHSPK